MKNIFENWPLPSQIQYLYPTKKDEPVDKEEPEDDPSLLNPIAHPKSATAAAAALGGLYLLYRRQKKKDNAEKERVFDIDPKFDKTKAPFNKGNIYK